MSAFDIRAALPTGTTVLEASAGTGKTYTIAALAARYLAEGVVELSELMVITFGRMATNELRMRVRERLVDVERALAERLRRQVDADEPAQVDHESGDRDDLDRAFDVHDDVTSLLLTGTDEELALRHRRVRAALADFDAATIATTHEFCQTMLDELGVLGDHEPDATFTDSLTDLTHEVATDCYLQRFAGDETPPPFDFGEATRIATDVIADETVPLVPVPVDPDSKIESTQRYAYACDVRRQLEARKAQRRLYSYSDMLTRLRDALIDPVRGPAAVARLRQRYAVVLVDEFQDTDPVQWQILRTAFAGHATLILIGDPKQAIYAFRGADVYSYLDAVGEAGTVGTLDVNWRSDAALVKALDLLMGGVSLGDRQIAVRPVDAHHQQRRLLPGQDRLHDQPDKPHADFTDQVSRLAPIRIRFQQHHPENDQLPRVRNLRRTITDDLVADITDLLSSGSLLTLQDPDGSTNSRPVKPADLAVLVRRNDRAEEIRTALTAAGVPAVVLGAGSVYSGPMATQWLTLLNALERPRQSQVRAAALTVFIGWTMQDLATADDDAITELSAQVRRWSRLLEHRGVAALVEAITAERDLNQRLLSSVGGERRLTDIRHIGQSLHAAMSSGQLGVGALIDWLRQRIDEAQSTGLDDRSRRLETDAQAVQILTIHRSKGLQFPIVYLPEAWDRFVAGKDDGRLLRLHDPDAALPPGESIDGTGTAGPLVLDVGGLGGPGRRERKARCRAEDDGEDLRLGYVAFTRAMTQVVTWWMPSMNTPCSALQRFLYRSQPGTVADPDGIAELAERYELGADPDLLGLPADLFSVEEITPRTTIDWRGEQTPTLRLDRRRFDRELDQDWRRTSYSALTAAAHGSETASAGVGSEVEPIKEDDETAASQSLTELDGPSGLGELPAADALSPTNRVSPMDPLPMGASFGTVVHAVLERVDPQADDLTTQLQQLAAEELARLPAGPMTVAALATALEPSLTTPLGPLADDRRLVDFPRTDRLAELTFELPLAGGDQPHADVRLGDIGRLLAEQLPADDPLVDYPQLLADPTLADQPLRGYLNGSIDAVLRLGGDQPRYLVVDYKTNWLGEVDQRPLMVARYAPSRLAEAMMRAHYPLQALLYSAALHRYLRWRQPGYDPQLHLGGALYLFLRGMAGPDTPRENGVPCGVFSWRPPTALITGLSDLLDGSHTPVTAGAVAGGRR